MAKLEKTRARKPLAESRAMFSWHNNGQVSHYALGVSNDSHSYRLKLEVEECVSFVAWFAGRETFDPEPSWASDKRNTIDKLRALADKLEAEDAAFMAELDKGNA